uniref:Uncharacterized protein n=1 Tax=Plectus sambesii TaxID=2011161 RepID=A0A914UWD8_9BILA
MQAISLSEDDTETEQPEMRAIQEQLRCSQTQLKDLAKQLDDIKQLLLEQRAPRAGRDLQSTMSYPSAFPMGVPRSPYFQTN